MYLSWGLNELIFVTGMEWWLVFGKGFMYLLNKNKINPCPCGVQGSVEETDSLAVKFSPKG